MPQVVNLAKKIIDRWSRLVFGIKTSYSRDIDDEDYDSHRDQYRRLKRKLQEMQGQAQALNESDQEDNKSSSNDQPKSKVKISH